MKNYRSRIGLEIWIPVAVLLGITSYPLISTKAWIGIFVVIGVALFILMIILKTTYTISDNKLIVRCWFFIYQKIDIYSIHRIRKTLNPISSPAASYLGRLEVHYNNGHSIIISPKNKKAFLSDLVSINKRILTKEAF